MEKQAVLDYIQRNPFTPYEEMIGKMLGYADSRAVEVFKAQFTDKLYGVLRAIYESGMDETMSKKVGLMIHNWRGLDGMKMCYFIFKTFGPFGRCLDYVVKKAGPQMLKNHWDGVGDWKC